MMLNMFMEWLNQNCWSPSSSYNSTKIFFDDQVVIVAGLREEAVQLLLSLNLLECSSGVVTGLLERQRTAHDGSQPSWMIRWLWQLDHESREGLSNLGGGIDWVAIEGGMETNADMVV